MYISHFADLVTVTHLIKKIFFCEKTRENIKGRRRLFLDYVNSWTISQLQKLHYLSEFLRLSEILNFFVERSSSRFFWIRPHRPIGLPNWPNRPFFEENAKNMISNEVFIKWPKMAEFFQKKFG